MENAIEHAASEARKDAAGAQDDASRLAGIGDEAPISVAIAPERSHGGSLARRRVQDWGIERLLGASALLPARLRVAAARFGARRGHGASALRAAPTDAQVLFYLGMYLSLAAHPDSAWRAVGQALTGASSVPNRTALPEVFGDGGARRRLAQAIAPHDAAAALALLDEADVVMRAACLAALDHPEAALDLIEGPASNSAEVSLVQASAQAALGRHGLAREAINAAFASHGLGAPLRIDDLKTRLADFETLEPRRSVEGPMVSVVIAMKNAEPTIVIAVRSLLHQTWAQIEIIIVNDASTDGSVARLRESFGNDPRVRLLDNRRRPGAYGARNTGIEAARGEFLTFHDADDWAHPDRLERQVLALTHGVGATVGGYFRLDQHGRVVNPRVFPVLRVNPILLLARRTTLNRMGPLDEVRAGGDTEYLARLEAKIGRWAILRLRQPLVVASWLPTSLMGSPETGLGTGGGVDRLAYVEQWRRRHAGLS